MALICDRSSLISVAMTVQFLALSATAAPPPTKFIDDLCQRVAEKAYCLMSLMGNPLAVAANGSIPLAEVVIRDGFTHNEKTVAFIDEEVERDPSRKVVFDECRKAYVSIGINFYAASAELMSNPDMANYYIMISYDQESRAKDLVETSTDGDSKTLLLMNDQMHSFIALAAAATEAVPNGAMNTFRA